MGAGLREGEGEGGRCALGSGSPAALPIGAAGFCSEDGSNLLPQNGTTIPGGQPDHVPVDSEVGVDKNVTEGYDLWPRYLRVTGLQVLGDPRSRLAYNREFLN